MMYMLKNGIGGSASLPSRATRRVGFSSPSSLSVGRTGKMFRSTSSNFIGFFSSSTLAAALLCRVSTLANGFFLFVSAFSDWSPAAESSDSEFSGRRTAGRRRGGGERPAAGGREDISNRMNWHHEISDRQWRTLLYRRLTLIFDIVPVRYES